MLHFLLHHTVYSFYLFLTLILTTQVNNLYYDFSHTINKKNSSIFLSTFPQIADLPKFLLFFIQNLLSCSDNIEENPEPKYSSPTFCYWNLNGLTAHDSTKISLIQAYITQYNYEIIRVTETFLNSSIQSDTNILMILMIDGL